MHVVPVSYIIEIIKQKRVNATELLLFAHIFKIVYVMSKLGVQLRKKPRGLLIDTVVGEPKFINTLILRRPPPHLSPTR